MGSLRSRNFRLGALLLAGGLGLLAADARVADAAAHKDIAAVRALIRQKADVNAPQADGMTALLWAAHHDEVAMAEALIKAGANVTFANRYGIVPLSEAALNGSSGIVELLLKNGADANTELPEGDTVLMLAAKSGNLATVKALLDKGAKVDAKEEWHGETALAIAAGQNHAGIVKLLIERGADVNSSATNLKYPTFKNGPAQVMSVYPNGGLSPLMQAVRDNAYEAAQALIAGKADLNYKDPDKVTALHVAVTNAHWDMAMLLIDSGADPNDGSLGLAADIKNLKFVRAAKDRPDQNNALNVIKALIAKGAKVDAPFEASLPVKATFTPKVSGPADATPLMRAAKTPDLEVMKLLLAAGADAKIAVKDGSTPLLVAAGFGPRGGGMATAAEIPREDEMIQAIQILKASGADINAMESTGQTAMHAAAGKGASKVVQFLYDNGVKLDVKDKRERTPLDVANGVVGKGPGGGGGGGFRPEPHPETAKLIRKLMGLPEEEAKPVEEKTSGAGSTEEPKKVASAQ